MRPRIVRIFASGLAVGCVAGTLFDRLSLPGVHKVAAAGDTLSPGECHRHYLDCIKAVRLRDSCNANSILPFGPPKGMTVLSYKNHMLQYDGARKVPLWVAEHLTREIVTSRALVSKKERRKGHHHYKRDYYVPEEFSFHPSELYGTGLSRRRMASPENNRHNKKAKADTFYLTNIIAQYGESKPLWRRLEAYCRDLTKIYPHVYVYSGPLFMPNTPGGGGCGKKLEEGMAEAVDGEEIERCERKEGIAEVRKTEVKYQVIGDSGVAVPPYLFKVIITQDEEKNRQMAAFIVPSDTGDTSGDELVKYEVDVKEVERRAGFIFAPDLDRNKVNKLSVDPDMSPDTPAPDAKEGS